MQDRFEKEVQRKLEELRLTPSAPVWEKVELEIKVEKKRRRVFLWLFLAGLLLAGSTWWLSDSFSENAEKSQSRNSQSPTVKKSQTPGNPIVDSKENIAKQESEKLPGNLSKQQPGTKTNDSRSNEDDRSIAVFTHKTLSKKLIVKTGTVLLKRNTTPEESSDVIVNQPIADNNIKQSNKIESNLPVGKQNTANDSINNTVVPPSEMGSKDSSVQVPLIKQAITESPMPDSSSKKKIASSKPWTRQVIVMAGSSSFTSALSLLKSSNVRESNLLGLGSGTPGLAGNNYQPSNMSAGLGFSIGAALSKKLNDHWEASFGLQYTHLSTRMKVGDKRRVDAGASFSADSSKVNEFFTNTSSTNYTNRFHILELPLNISYKPSNKLPLYISAGISYGRLISTNALSFSTTSNVYYKNKQNYSQHLLPAQLSAQYRLGSKNKRSLQAGPFIQYNLIKLNKEGGDGKSHMLFTGLKTIVNF